jgi:hypothetical protein
MTRRIFLTLVVAFGAVLTVSRVAAQGINNVRINEVLVVNEDNYEDDYGHRSSWIELFNSGHELVDLRSCYLAITDAGGRETRYIIPSGDPKTAMHSQSYLVFFCEGTETKGTFYTNFTLDDAILITLYNTNGRDVIDRFRIDPAGQVADVSVGYMSRDGISDPVVMSLPRTTPNATNETNETVPKHELFHQRDRSGAVMAIIAMLVVFSSLILVFLVLKCFGLVMTRIQRLRDRKAAEGIAAKARRKTASVQVEEEMAAIALALKMYQEELHIREATVITINRASRVYSPWSSKIHGIPPTPNKK